MVASVTARIQEQDPMSRSAIFRHATTVALGLAVPLAGCSHQVQFYGGTRSVDADAEFQREIERRDADVKKCYTTVAVTDDVPLEMVVDATGKPLAATATGPIFGSTLAGCMETVAFKIRLAPGSGRRIAHATAAMHPMRPETIPPQAYRLQPVPDPNSEHTAQPGDTMTPVVPQQENPRPVVR